MRSIESGNRFLDFATSIADRYKGIPGAFDSPLMNYLQEEKEEEEQQSVPLPASVTYIDNITNIKEENILYQNNISFLTNILQKQFYQKYYPTLVERIQKLVENTITEGRKTIVEKAEHIIDERISSKTEQIIDEKISSKTEHIIDERISSKTEHIIDERISSKTDKIIDERISSKTDKIIGEKISSKTEQIINERIIRESEQSLQNEADSPKRINSRAQELSATIIKMITRGDKDIVGWLKSNPETAETADVLYRNIINTLPENMKASVMPEEMVARPMLVNEENSGKPVFRLENIKNEDIGKRTILPIMVASDTNKSNSEAVIEPNVLSRENDGRTEENAASARTPENNIFNIHNIGDTHNFSIKNNLLNKVDNSSSYNSLSYSNVYSPIRLMFAENGEANPEAENIQSTIPGTEANATTDAGGKRDEIRLNEAVMSMQEAAAHDRRVLADIVIKSIDRVIDRETDSIVNVNESEKKVNRLSVLTQAVSQAVEDRIIENIEKTVLGDKVVVDSSFITNIVAEQVYRRAVTKIAAANPEDETIVRLGEQLVQSRRFLKNTSYSMEQAPLAYSDESEMTGVKNHPQSPNADFIRQSNTDEAVRNTNASATVSSKPVAVKQGFEPIAFVYSTEDEEEERQLVERVMGELQTELKYGIGASFEHKSHNTTGNDSAIADKGKPADGGRITADNSRLTTDKSRIALDNSSHTLDNNTSAPGRLPVNSSTGAGNIKIGNTGIGSIEFNNAEAGVIFEGDAADNGDNASSEVAKKIVFEAENIISQYVQETSGSKIKLSSQIMAARTVATRELEHVIMEYRSGEMDEETAGEHIDSIIGRLNSAYGAAGYGSVIADTALVNSSRLSENNSSNADIYELLSGRSSLSSEGIGSLSEINTQLTGGNIQRIKVRRGRYTPVIAGTDSEASADGYYVEELVYGEDSGSAANELRERTGELQKQVDEVQNTVRVVKQQNVVKETEITNITENVVHRILKEELSSESVISDTTDFVRREVANSVATEMDQSIDYITNKIYQKLEQRLRTERGRRGLN